MSSIPTHPQRPNNHLYIYNNINNSSNSQNYSFYNQPNAYKNRHNINYANMPIHCENENDDFLISEHEMNIHDDSGSQNTSRSEIRSEINDTRRSSCKSGEFINSYNKKLIQLSSSHSNYVQENYKLTVDMLYTKYRDDHDDEDQNSEIETNYEETNEEQSSTNTSANVSRTNSHKKCSKLELPSSGKDSGTCSLHNYDKTDKIENMEIERQNAIKEVAKQNFLQNSENTTDLRLASVDLDSNTGIYQNNVINEVELTHDGMDDHDEMEWDNYLPESATTLQINAENSRNNKIHDWANKEINEIQELIKQDSLDHRGILKRGVKFLIGRMIRFWRR